VLDSAMAHLTFTANHCTVANVEDITVQDVFS